MKFKMSDFEKIELGILTAFTVITVLVMYIIKGTVDANLIYLVTILVSAFVARKGLKYHYQYGQLNGDSNSSDDSEDSTTVTNTNTTNTDNTDSVGK